MRTPSVCVWIRVGLMLGVAVGCTKVSEAQRPPTAREEETFRFRFVGPRAGNRVASSAGVPGDPSTY